MFGLGCAARRNNERGIVVLAFGSPRTLASPTSPYGTRLLVGFRTLVNTQDIAQAATTFARGYMARSCIQRNDPGQPNLIIALGTSNSRTCENDQCLCTTSANRQPSRANCNRDDATVVNWVDNRALTRAHGQAWRAMVTAVNAQLRKDRSWPLVRAADGYDAEYGAPDWNSSGTMEWADGFTRIPSNAKNDPNGRLPVFLYNFGSCEDCPRKQPYSSWTRSQKARLEQVYQLSWGLPNTRALPQIYFAPYAQEWFNVRRYAQEQHREQMDIAGVMTGCRDQQRAGCSFNDPRHWSEYPVGEPQTTLPPAQGWLALYETLNASTTPDGDRNRYRQRVLPWVTDITRDYLPTQ